jgi:hypothetical protein
MHIYAFGSLCRGDVDLRSDIDLLAIVDGRDDRFDPEAFSIYGYTRIKEIWSLGHPFAWHLHLESRFLHASDGSDFIASLGPPAAYTGTIDDCLKFLRIFQVARAALETETPSPVFELSSVFLAIRNFATCYSLGASRKPDFSRYSSLRLGDDSLDIDQSIFAVLERSRILSTRGKGALISTQEIGDSINSLASIQHWMESLACKIQNQKQYE